MTTKYGDFVPPVFHTIGDPYKSTEPSSERDKGLSFIATVGRRGKNNDACFGKAKILYEGERHVDPSRQKLLANAEKRKNFITDTPFKSPSPMKRSAGHGDFFGTFQGNVPYIAGSPDVPLKKGDMPATRPNLYTSPGKKGTYGFIKTTLSEHQGAGGALGEYHYIADPYNRGKVLEAKAQARSKRATDAPFVPTNPARKGGSGYIKTNIGNNAHGIAGEYQYQPCGLVTSATYNAKVETAFVPPRIAKAGYNCTFSKFPVYAADPEQLKRDAQQRAKKMSQELMPANAWSPPHIPKAGATRSIVRMNM
eukprot:jgi/Ulvmu1/5873/UM250_0001.1